MIHDFNGAENLVSTTMNTVQDHSYEATGTHPPKRSFTSDLSEFEDEVPVSDDPVRVDEVSRYINSSIHDYFVSGNDQSVVGGIDLLAFWKLKAAEFPGLSGVARCILCIPASSAASERAFSISGRVFEERRTRLSSDTFDSILLLNSFNKLDKT